MKCNKNLGENRKESQLPSKSEGCNERYGFRGNCDSQGKLGMCPSLAESDSGGFSKASRRQPKVFRCSSFLKMLPRCGRAAHICGANEIYKYVFPAAIAFFKAFKFKQSCIMRIKTVNSSKATGQLQHAGRQKQGWNPLLPDVEDRFP